jgi:OmcA/MtrC family decaheme c-type cytochrome
MKRKLSYVFSALIFLGAGLTVAQVGVKPTYRPGERRYYLSADPALEAVFSPSLELTIQNVTITGTSVAVTFQITDDNGQGLDRLGVDTPGAVSTSFVLAAILPGDIQYTNYFTNRVTASTIPPGCKTCTVGGSWNQPTTDSGGTYASLGGGMYTYTFGKQLPANYATDSTTTVGMFAQRNLSSLPAPYTYPLDTIGLTANATYDFVPSGAPVTQVRDVVATAACNQCHDPLNQHGSAQAGPRQQVKLCVLCHNPGNEDPYTGNSLDFKVYIHKIHMGINKPSESGKPLNILGTSGLSTATVATGATQAPEPAGYVPPGTPYQIIGFNQSLNDFSAVVWPQDVRNCTTCHQQATQANNWMTNPSRAACGSCHDNVNFATGQNHPGGVQTDDTQCSICHPADTGLEFDLSVTGVHTMPWKSKQLAGLNLAITGVTNATPGSHPQVSFTVTNNAGNPVALSALNSLNLTISGPTSDYAYLLPATGFQGAFGDAPGNNPWFESALTATAGPSGYTYTMTGTMPSNASGTWAVGAEGYQNLTITGSLVGQSFPVRQSAFNPVFYFSVDGSPVVPRRTVVAVSNCNVCHETLAHHGGNERQNTQYCVLCHNPNHVDNNTPATTVNFRTMIMGLHMGSPLGYSGFGLASTYTINTTNANGLLYPGDQRDCAKCHVGTTYEVPLPAGLIPTVDPTFWYSPLQPTASACLGCHNGEDDAAHAYQMTAPFGEACQACHAEGDDFAVSLVHAR